MMKRLRVRQAAAVAPLASAMCRSWSMGDTPATPRPDASPTSSRPGAAGPPSHGGKHAATDSGVAQLLAGHITRGG
jgi:hypothetical protein